MLDLSVVVLTPAIIFMSLFNFETTVVKPFIVVSILLMYLRFFYFLRIFDSTAPLVRAIVEITFDIRNFLVILFIGVLGCGISFYVLSSNNDPELSPEDGGPFIESVFGAITYSYMIALGDFDAGTFGSNSVPLVWLVFFISSTFTLIILLNMLIAIMSESFARVTSQEIN